MGQSLRQDAGNREASATVVSATVERARAGDDNAIRALYVRYAGVVRCYVFRILRDRDAADDVTQTTFLKFLTNPRRYEQHDATFEAWLLRVARNAAYDELRKRRGVLDLDERQTPTPTRIDDQIVEALRGVPEPERRILVLRHLVGLSTRETGERLTMSDQTVRDLERRGQDSLGPLIDKSFSTPPYLRGALPAGGVGSVAAAPPHRRDRRVGR